MSTASQMRIRVGAATAALLFGPVPAAADPSWSASAASGSAYACNQPPGAWSRREVGCVIRRVWPRRLERQALRVAWCESRLDPHAANPASSARGVFQFLRSTWATTPWRDESRYDPVANTRAAWWLYRTSGGWRSWSCRP